MYASRCKYMTRISNGFQLTLERENVFFEYYADDEKVEPSQRDSKRWMYPALISRTCWCRSRSSNYGPVDTHNINI